MRELARKANLEPVTLWLDFEHVPNRWLWIQAHGRCPGKLRYTPGSSIHLCKNRALCQPEPRNYSCDYAMPFVCDTCGGIRYEELG